MTSLISSTQPPGPSPGVAVAPDCAGTRHGDLDAYKHHGCRCPGPRALNTRHNHLRALGHVGHPLIDATGALRRRQALAVMGWGPRELAPMMGFDNEASVRRSTDHPQIRKPTHDRWVRVYRELWGLRGPNDRARTHAVRAGWPGPTAWVNIDDPTEQPADKTRCA